MKKKLKKATILGLALAAAVGYLPVEMPEVKAAESASISSQAFPDVITEEMGTKICFSPVYFADLNPDLKEAYGYDYDKLLNHWRSSMWEGRITSPIFDVRFYLAYNPDIAELCGTDYEAAYKHFCEYGLAEGRVSSPYYSGQFLRNYYQDLADMDYYSLAIWYLTYGIGENRMANPFGNVLSGWDSSVFVPRSEELNYDVVDLKQNDPRWKDIKIKNANLGTVGCFLTSLAMTESYYNGDQTYPHEVMEKVSFNGDSVTWKSVKDLGYEYTQKEYGCKMNQEILRELYEKLKTGPVIIGGVGSRAHWVVVYGYNGDGGEDLAAEDFLIRDPGSSWRSNLKQFLNVYPTVKRLVWK